MAGSEKILPFPSWYRTMETAGSQMAFVTVLGLIIGDALDYCKTSPIVKRVLLSTTAAKSEPLMPTSGVVRCGYKTTGSSALINQLLLWQVKSYHSLFHEKGQIISIQSEGEKKK